MRMRVIADGSAVRLAGIMDSMRVDPYGVRVMVPKGLRVTVCIETISSVAATILKQEMLSIGGDCALPRDVLTGKLKQTPCLLMGSLADLNELIKKLRLQPFGLAKLSEKLARLIADNQLETRTVFLGAHRMKLGTKTRVMGIVNLTADSFSGDGLCAGGKKPDPRAVLEYAQYLVTSGADIIDVGAESSRPGAVPVGLKEETERLAPVVSLLAKKLSVPVSVDTRKPRVALKALDCGASMINDISGLRERGMLDVVSRSKAGVVIMHMKGTPRTMQKQPEYDDVTGEIADSLAASVEKAVSAGIGRNRIIIDPGIGFGKTAEHNLRILHRLEEFKSLGLPILIGTSRKSFIAKITGNEGRLMGTVASCVLAARNGAHIVRVHDVKAVSDALKVNASIQAEKLYG